MLLAAYADVDKVGEAGHSAAGSFTPGTPISDSSDASPSTSGASGASSSVGRWATSSPLHHKLSEANRRPSAAAWDAAFSDQYGYAAVGGVDPERDRDAPRLHPNRTFLPGQTYEPEVRPPPPPPLLGGGASLRASRYGAAVCTISAHCTALNE